MREKRRNTAAKLQNIKCEIANHTKLPHLEEQKRNSAKAVLNEIRLRDEVKISSCSEKNGRNTRAKLKKERLQYD